MTTRKFEVGQQFRPAYVPASQPQLRLGRLLTVVEVIPATHGTHCYYRAASRKGWPGAEIRSDRARKSWELYRRRVRHRRAAKD
jgi:hypothetical protein